MRLDDHPLAVDDPIPVTQSPYPPPQYPYRVVGDPAPLCRRAGIFLFVLGMLVALYGVGNMAVLVLRPPEELMSQLKQQMPPGQEVPFEMIQVMGIIISAMIIAVGLAIMILSGPVRRGKKGAVLAAMIIVGFVGGMVALMTACSAIGGLASPATFGAACCLTVPLSLAIWLFVMLMQAHRALGLADQAMAMQRQGMQPGPGGGFPPVYPQGPAAPGQGSEGGSPPQSSAMNSTPPASPPSPGFTMFAPPAPPPGAAGQQHLFGPAPFGIPPPPDELPPGKYGYATRPPSPPPPVVAPPPPPQTPPTEPPAAC
jgi:hypothetical protein